MKLPEHPFERLTPRARSGWFIALLLLALLIGGAMLWLGSDLHTAAAPLGVISFEVAGGHAQAVLDSWSPAMRRDALLLQGLDYLFLFVYSAGLAMACVRVLARLGERAPALSRLGRGLAWGQFAAGLCDAIENVPLILMLRGEQALPGPALVAQIAATSKFALVVLGLAYWLGAGLVARWLARR